MGCGFGDFDGTRRAAGNRCQKCYRALDGPRLLGWVHPALEALTGIGRKTQAARATEDRGRRKVRRLKEDIGGRGCDRRALTTHDAREPDRTFAVGDEEYIRFRAHELPIE